MSGCIPMHNNSSNQPSPSIVISSPLPMGNKIKIYLRQTNKYGIKIEINNPISIAELKDIVRKEMGICIDEQILYIGGRRFGVDEQPEQGTQAQQQLTMDNGAIVHVRKIDEFGLGDLKIYLQEVGKQGSIGKPVQYKVKCQVKISEFLKQNLNSTQIQLIDSGRKLDLQKSFKQNQISNGSTITYFSLTKQINHDQFQKDFNKLFEQQQQTQSESNKKQMEEDIAAKAKQWKKRKLQSKSKRLIKQDLSSSDQIQNYQPKPNFKKKKLICLKAVKSNPEDNDYTWRRDSSFSQSKHDRKKLKKALSKKHEANPNSNLNANPKKLLFLHQNHQ